MRRTLYVYRSKLALVPYSLGESRTLEKKLSIYDYNSGKYTMCLYKYDKDKKTLYIPKGFSKDETLNILATDTIVEIDIVDKTNETKEGRDIELIMKPGKGARDEHQINSISFLLEKDTKQQRFLNIDTGFGKTFCTIKAISMIGKAAMIIMANSNLMKQWINSFKNFTNIKDHEICIISGRDTVEKAIKAKEKAKIYICSTQTMAIMSEENKLQEFIDSCGIGIKVIDEAHEMMTAVVAIDLGCDVYINFYLTATPERSDTREALLYLRITKTFLKFGGYTADIMQYVHVKNVYINTYPSPWHKRICNTRQGFSAVLYEKFIFKNDRKKTFFYLICKYVCSKILSNDPEAKILIVLSIRDSINEIARLFSNNDHIKCGIFTNDTDPDKKAKQLNRNIILSTLKSSGAGMDIKNLRCIINFVPFKSTVLLHQLMGRLRYIEGKALFYFNIVDDGYENITRQNIKRQYFFRSKAADIKNMRLDMNVLLSMMYKERKQLEGDADD